MCGTRLNKPVVGIVSDGDGYLMVASDGGVFTFSDQPFVGSLASDPQSSPVVAIASVAKAPGLGLVTAAGLHP